MNSRQRTIPLKVDTFKNESVAFGGIVRPNHM